MDKDFYSNKDNDKENVFNNSPIPPSSIENFDEDNTINMFETAEQGKTEQWGNELDNYNELNDGLDNSLNIRTDDTPIEGQIGIEELYIRQHDEDDQEEEILTPIENQVSLDEFFKSDEFLKNKQILNEDNFGIFNLTPIKRISEFFDNNGNNDNSKNNENNENNVLLRKTFLISLI